MILVNLQNAFGTLDHKILLGRMKCTGFSDKTITWFHSHLTKSFFRFINSLNNDF